jgi:hypothetical protein
LGRAGYEEEFGRSLADLMDWVEQRQLLGEPFPGILAWAVMLARLGPAFDDSFLARLGAWDWSQPVGLFTSRSSFPGPMTVLAPAFPERNLTSGATGATVASVRKAAAKVRKSAEP